MVTGAGILRAVASPAGVLGQGEPKILRLGVGFLSKLHDHSLFTAGGNRGGAGQHFALFRELQFLFYGVST
jgi:hypothetical protein